ncbi:MAG TPA: STT3 domain-containing protein, partial [Candidatus Nanoarchaeia archaeon]|nr:STT3 domain-containing protein [Candidatus Nanoarchaeia archaeon]
AVGWTYKILHAINNAITLRFAFVYVPVFLAMLSVIPAFFLARRLGGNFGGFFAALLVALHPNYLSRTLGGATDTDVYNVFFPLFIFWFFVESFEAKQRLPKLTYMALAAFGVGLYSFAWGGWWYIFDFILFTVIAYFAYHLLLAWRKGHVPLSIFHDTNIREFGIAVIGFLIVSAVTVSLFTSWNDFTEAPLSPLKIFTLKQASQESLWPNVYTTVAELNEAGIDTIVGSLGGRTLLLLSLLGLVIAVGRRGNSNRNLLLGSLVYYLLLFSLQSKITNALLFTALLGLPVIAGIALALFQRAEIDVLLALVFAMWYIGMIYSSTKGVRFTMLIVPPFAIGLGIFAGYTTTHLGNWLHQQLKISTLLTKGILILLLSALLIAPVRAGWNASEQGVPLINDAWWHVLEKIKAETPPHAIITSWWDYGHWFKAVADRPVTFDGANQNNPQAHWVGKFFLTWNEQEALGILRMLDCGGMEGANYLNNYLKDTYQTVLLMNKIILLPTSRAREVLSQALPPEAVDRALQYTHCMPPPAVVITSEDMVGKSGVWAHFGAWDFSKAKAWITARGKTEREAVPALMDALAISEEQARALYTEIANLPDEGAANRWIAPWPGISSGAQDCQSVDNRTVACPVSIQGKTVPLQIDLQTYNADIVGTDVRYHPDSLAYKDGDFHVRLYTNNTIGISLLLFQNGDRYSSVFVDPQHGGSMFTRLFYFDGAGTKYFRKMAQERDVTGLDIIAWQVDWDTYLQDLGETMPLPESPYKANYPSWI